MSSTSALYSMCAGKPVIIVNLENTVNYSEYKNSNAVWEANSSLELRKLLIDHLMNKIPKHDLSKKNKSRIKFISDRCYATDGKSAFRVSKLITSMIKF